jgi:hypothetical protein
VTLVQPKKSPPGGALTPPEKATNRRIASIRIRIEHAIGGVKRYRIVKDTIRLLKDGLDAFGWDAKIKPWGHLGDFQVGIRTVEHLAYDLLHPGRTGLGIGSDDDVIGAKPQIVSDRRIEVMIVKFAGFLWLNDRVAHHGFPCLRRSWVGGMYLGPLLERSALSLRLP